MSNATPEELAQAVSTPTTFSFTERLRGRNYPKDTVEIYLDEELGYQLNELEEKISLTVNPEQLAKFEAEAGVIKAKLAPQKYVIHLEGVSNKKYDQFIDDAAAAFPLEYVEETAPFTGAKTKVAVPSEARDTYFTNLFWAECMKSIVDPSGAIQDTVTMEDAQALREEGPREGIVRVANMINKLRMAVEWMHYIQDEDFLAKP